MGFCQPEGWKSPIILEGRYFVDISLTVMLGHNNLTYFQDYIFLSHSNSNLGSLFYTAQRCKKFYRIGPRWAVWIWTYELFSKRRNFMMLTARRLQIQFLFLCYFVRGPAFKSWVVRYDKENSAFTWELGTEESHVGKISQARLFIKTAKMERFHLSVAQNRLAAQEGR